MRRNAIGVKDNGNYRIESGPGLILHDVCPYIGIETMDTVIRQAQASLIGFEDNRDNELRRHIARNG